MSGSEGLLLSMKLERTTSCLLINLTIQLFYNSFVFNCDQSCYFSNHHPNNTNLCPHLLGNFSNSSCNP